MKGKPEDMCIHYIEDTRVSRCKLDKTPCIFAVYEQKWCQDNPKTELPERMRIVRKPAAR